MIIKTIENVFESHDHRSMRIVCRITLWLVISISGRYLHGQELGEIPAQLEPRSPSLGTPVDVSAPILKHLALDVNAEISRIREMEHLPRLKPFHPWEMNRFCDTQRFGIGSGVHHMGSNPLTGTRTVLFFEAHSPLDAKLELKEIALQERPH